jgi:6,7-dimethyl-8-ribityllumazine synthase
MLKPVRKKTLAAGKGRFAIIASQYNELYVNAMLQAAKAELKRAGAKKISVFRVPGAFEIPVLAARLARLSSHATCRAVAPSEGGSRITHHDPPFCALICLGVILRGETVHAAHIGEAVSQALMQIQVQYEVPVIHEVLLLENEAQARARCLGPKHNRGAEAAQTALAMAEVMGNARRSQRA